MPSRPSLPAAGTFQATSTTPSKPSDTPGATLFSATPSPLDLPPGPLTLTEFERNAMPESLRHALAGWLHAHRAEQTREVWHKRLQIPSTGASLTMIGEVLLRCIADPSAPMAVLDAWLRAPQRLYGASAPFARPHDVVLVAVASRRLDLLTTVLDAPGFCPNERERETWPTAVGPNPEQKAWLDRHGKALFNGGVARTMGVKPGGGMARAVLEAAADFIPAQRPSENERSTDPFWTWLDVHNPKTQGWPALPRTWSTFFDPEQTATTTKVRHQPHTNLVGLAVMMGWTDGVRTLLDHGVDPYAWDTAETPSPVFVSPLMLALHLDERDAVRLLVQHPSFRPTHHHGYTDSQWERRQTIPDDVGQLWPQTAAYHGGLDLAVLLEYEVANDPAVSTAVADAMNRLKPSTRKRLERSLAEQPRDHGRRCWEKWVLQQTLVDAPDAARARPRL